MSALGDYIHLTTTNYLNYGTSKKGPKDDFIGYKNYLQSRIKNIKGVQPQTLEILKQRLERESDNQIQKDIQINDSNFQKKIDIIYETMANITEQGMLGRFEGSSAWKYSGDWSNVKQQTLTQAQIEQKKKLIGSIRTILNKIELEGSITSEETNQLIQMYNILSGKNISNNKSSIGIVQEDIDNYSFNTWISHVAGDFGERLVAACDDKVEELGLEAIREVINQSVVGAQRSTIAFDKNLLARDLSAYGISTDKTGSQYKLGSTQNKVDVDITLNKENVLASVKNYYNPTKVTLQDSVSLLSALIFLNQQNNFSNHWLNMHAGHLVKGSNKTAADETVAQEIAYDALVAGNPLKQNVDQANVFVILDRKTGKAIVKSTSDILMNDFNNIKISPKIQGIKFKNQKKNKLNDRIADILMQVHQKQLHVSYKLSE